jgi:hypothetical protein
VQRRAIDIAIHRDGADAQFAASANDTHRDLAPVGDQYFLEHFKCPAARNITTLTGAMLLLAGADCASAGWQLARGRL